MGTKELNLRKKKKKLSPGQRREKLRAQLWPSEKTWHRLENDGYITIPKLLSMVCSLIKQLSENDPSSVYLDLWCWSFDEAIIVNIDEDSAAFASGYVGTRAKRTWTEHIWNLEKLGFIKIASQGNNPIGHILLVDPLEAVDKLRKKNKIPPEWWTAYITRADIVRAVLPSDPVDDDED